MSLFGALTTMKNKLYGTHADTNILTATATEIMKQQQYNALQNAKQMQDQAAPYNNALGPLTQTGNSTSGGVYSITVGGGGGVIGGSGIVHTQYPGTRDDTWAFTVKKISNGYTMRYGKEEMYCTDYKELGDRVVAFMVQQDALGDKG